MCIRDSIHTEDITRAAMAQVAITATRPNGTKWSGLRVYAKNSVYAFYQLAGSTDGNGALTLFGVPEGAFSVRFFDPATGIMLHEAQGAVLPANDDGIVNLAVQIAAARGGVSGTVFAADGTTTVTGAIVQIFNADDGKFVAQTTSSATGAYSFANMIFSQGGFSVRAASFWNANLAGTSVGTIGSDGQSVVVDVTIPAVLGSISGKVTTPGGEAISGASISTLDPSAGSEVPMTATSTTGEYQIDNYLAPLTGFNVVARIGGVSAQKSVTFTTQHDTATANLELGVRNVAVQVRVLGGDAATAVRGAFVEVHSPDDAYLGGGSTNTNGLVTVGPLWVPLTGVTIVADYRSQTQARLNVPVFDPAIPIDVVMPMSVVKGRVLFANLTATNRPNVFAEGPDGVTWQAFDTTVTGDYVVFGTAVGPIQLTGQDRFSGLRVTVDEAIVSIGTAVTHDLVLPPTGTVQGTLFDDKGAPVPSQTVELASQGLEFTRWAETDANGKFTFTDVPAGAVAIYAAPYTDDGQVFATAADTVVANATLTLDLHPVQMTTVTGTVVDAAGVPIRSVWIELEAFGGGSPSAHFSDWRDANEDGTFTFDRVPVGPIKLTATTWNGTQGAVQFLELTPTTPPVTLTLGTGAPLEKLLTTDTGFVYGITSSGSLNRGAPQSAATSDWAYSSTYDASTNRDYFCCSDVAALSLAERQLTVGPLYQDMLLQTRKVFVPQSGAFVRYLEIIENPLPIPMKATVQMWGYIRQSSSRTKVAVAPVDTGNTYVVLEDTFGGRTPTAPVIAHVVRGAGAVPAKTAFTSTPTSGADNYTEYQWTVTVPPNGKVALMHFSVLRQPNNTAGAQSQAVSLVELTDPEALAGLTAAEKAAIKNFIISGVK